MNAVEYDLEECNEGETDALWAERLNLRDVWLMLQIIKLQNELYEPFTLKISPVFIYYRAQGFVKIKRNLTLPIPQLFWHRH